MYNNDLCQFLFKVIISNTFGSKSVSPVPLAVEYYILSILFSDTCQEILILLIYLSEEEDYQMNMGHELIIINQGESS